jgi:hypothetical protein
LNLQSSRTVFVLRCEKPTSHVPDYILARIFYRAGDLKRPASIRNTDASGGDWASASREGWDLREQLEEAIRISWTVQEYLVELEQVKNLIFGVENARPENTD